MPHPSSRLDLYLVPQGDAEEVRAKLRSLFDAWVKAGWVRRDGASLPGLSEIVHQGCRRVRLDLPDSRVLYANQQGGFRSNCRGCAAPVVHQLAALVSAYGSADKVACDGCGEDLTGVGVEFKPHAAIGFGALVLCDVGAFDLQPGAMEALAGEFGAWDLVGRRV